jgi:aryl-alcohol dehydrogenase-like predicted oxidoreductase
VKFALGTAQFGLDYGIANRDGQVPLSEVQQILQTARSVGVDTLDTAAEYGESESCLGELGVDTFNVVTKLPAQIDKSKSIEEWVETCVHASLRRLNVSSVYGLLLHRSNQFLTKSGKDFINVINNLKASGLIKKFGVSIYDPSELDAVTQISMPDIVQAPLNVFDRRLITSGWLQKLHDRGTEVYSRSVFLQGLLLLPRNRIPHKFDRWSNLFSCWFDFLDANSLDPIKVCLESVMDHRVNYSIVGVNSEKQLEQVFLIYQQIKKPSLFDMECNDLNLIDPANWSKL